MTTNSLRTNRQHLADVGKASETRPTRRDKMPRMKSLRIFILALALSGLVFGSNAQDPVSDLLGRINSLRGSLGLEGYTLNGALSAAAMNQAQWMASTGQISHTQTDGSTPSSRAAAAGYAGSWVSENIYAGTNAGVNSAWTFWMNSAIHYRGMTNPNYQEIGIAAASGSWGRAYVLVFGRVGGTTYTVPNRSGNSSAASAPPSFVVGLDNFGNIMHEVQPEQTIGDILLTYGYTWDDMQEFLMLNEKSYDDIRSLQIGEIVLVPPYEGTYTPTPYPEGWPTNTPEADDFVATAIAGAAARATEGAANPSPTVTPSPTPTNGVQTSPTPEPTAQTGVVKVATSAELPAFLVSTQAPTQTNTPESAAALSTTSTPAMTIVASLNASSESAASIQDVVAVSPQGESPWLIIALVAQSAIIFGAAVMFIRNMRKK